MNHCQEFLRQTALFNAIGAAFQRATIYADGCEGTSKDQLKRDLECRLRKIENEYCIAVSSNEHFHTIAGLARDLSKRYGHILHESVFRVGTAQKAVNIYLKLIWCYGWIPEPPHCPIDSIVLAEIGDHQTKWTRMKDIADYLTAINTIRAHLGRIKSTLSLSQWELDVWNNRRKRGVQQGAEGDA